MIGRVEVDHHHYEIEQIGDHVTLWRRLNTGFREVSKNSMEWIRAPKYKQIENVGCSRPGSVSLLHVFYLDALSMKCSIATASPSSLTGAVIQVAMRFKGG